VASWKPALEKKQALLFVNKKKQKNFILLAPGGRMLGVYEEKFWVFFKELTACSRPRCAPGPAGKTV
jgi:hypothetical protein